MYSQNDNSNPGDSNIPDYLRTSSVTPRPVDDSASVEDPNAAANLIRQKLAAIYADEPNAKQEAQEVAQVQPPLSRHQQYMRSLQTSGQSWAEIQNAWHAYYQSLSDMEKHEVWQEFYAANRTATPFQQQMYQRDTAHNAATSSTMQPAQVQMPLPAPSPQAGQPAQPLIASHPQHIQEARAGRQTHHHLQNEEYQGPSSHYEQFQPAVIPARFTPSEVATKTSKPKPEKERPSVADIKKRIRASVKAGGKLKKSDHLKSLGFGLATGAIVVFIFLFGFFNEVFITPFIQPSRQANETPIIVNTASAPVSSTPEVIIPKINVEIPVDYTQSTIDESAIENALDKGVVHYPTTVLPGQAGNAAFFGHSSNNIFNPGKYKFAFVLLHKLVEGDTFYLTNNGKTYVYQVISRKVVDPSEVGVLGPVPNETATATLITCDPPGTSLKRLVVVGRQISPDPSGNAAPASPTPSVATTESATSLPGNGPTLWSRMWHSIF